MMGAIADEDVPEEGPATAAAGDLFGLAKRMSVSSLHAFSWVNQSARCSSLRQGSMSAWRH